MDLEIVNIVLLDDPKIIKIWKIATKSSGEFSIDNSTRYRPISDLAAIMSSGLMDFDLGTFNRRLT